MDSPANHADAIAELNKRAQHLLDVAEAAVAEADCYAEKVRCCREEAEALKRRAKMLFASADALREPKAVAS